MGVSAMSMSGNGFSADSVRNLIASKKQKQEAEQRELEEASKAQRKKLHDGFLEREIRPEALDRVATMVQKAVERGDKQALLFQFPSEWLPDKGRAVTNRDPQWHAQLDGFAKRAYDFYAQELAPRGFQLRAEILDWPGGMPGDVGFVLTWKRPEEIG
jgi:hypothetical protein